MSAAPSSPPAASSFPSLPSQPPPSVDFGRTSEAFAAIALLAGLSVDEIGSAVPPGAPLPRWLEGCRGSREDRAQVLAPALYRLQLTCGEAARWP